MDATTKSLLQDYIGTDPLSLIQAFLEPMFVSKWVTPNDYFELVLPIEPGSKCDFTVRWGDGTTDVVTDIWAASHIYSKAGEYEIQIHGIIEGFSFRHFGMMSPHIHHISEWGPLLLADGSRQFALCSNLNISSLDEPRLDHVTSMVDMFHNASGFNGNLSGWDTAGVMDMNRMFQGSSAFNGDVSGWDTGRVENMSHMFENATAFNGDLGEWNTSMVTDMSWMFKGASAFDGDVSEWDTGNVTDMSHMFQAATVFNGDLSGWVTAEVNDMCTMFTDASAFDGDVSAWDTGNVTDMSHMFDNATAFNGDLSRWDTAEVDDMCSMFQGASAFNGDMEPAKKKRKMWRGQSL